MKLSETERLAKLSRINEMAEKVERGAVLTTADRDEFDKLEIELRADNMEWSGRHTNDGITGQASASERADTPEQREFSEYLRTGRAGPELRAAGEVSGSAGGFMVPTSFWADLKVALKKYGGMSQDFAQLETEDGRITPYPTNNPISTLASYLTENSQVSDVNYVFGQGVLYAWTLVSGAIKASLQLVQDSAIDVDAFVATRVGEQIGRKIAAEVVSGAGPGSNAATGIIPSLNAFGAVSGASGGVLTLGTATAVKLFSAAASTELITNTLAPQTCLSMVEAVDPAYYDGAAFYMNNVQAMGMRGVADANGRPLLNLDNGYFDGAIGSIFGFPVKVVNEIPNLTASTTGGPLFANMQHAMVLRMVRGAGLMRLTERYADFLQVGFIGYQRWDSQPVDLRAACVVKASTT